MTPTLSARPALLVTRDERLLDDLLRLAAAAGATLDVAHDSSAALREWAGAAVVLVGVDLAEQVAEQRPPRRDHVHVVGHGTVADPVFRAALAVGAVDVVELPMAASWVVELLTDAVDTRATAARPHAYTVGVVPGSGGSGATTFACALALTAARRRQAMLLDLDPLGPGVDRVVGLDAPTGVRWDALASSRGRLGSRSLRAALPEKDGLAVLTWDLGSPVDLDGGSVREVLSAARRGNDVVVVDLPRGVDDVTAEVLSRCDRVLVVANASVAGVASAGKVAAVLGTLNENLGVVVRARGAAVPPDHVAATLGLPLVAEVPHQRRLAEHVDLGLGPVHGRRSGLARAARLVLAGQEAA
jgi:secretion/DNA translocation related CpaE-like protein